MRTLFTKRLILRSFETTDSKDMYEYAKLSNVGPMAGWPPHENEDESKKVIEFFIDANDVFAIELKEEGKVIGSLGIHERKPDELLENVKQKELGYVLNPKYWGKGIMIEAVERVIKLGFEDLDLDIIWCGHFENNEKSKKVIEKTGFQYKFAKTKKMPLLQGKEQKIYYYSITKEMYTNSEK